MPTSRLKLRAPIIVLWIAGILWCGIAAGQVPITIRRTTVVSLPVVAWAEVAAILPERGPQVSFGRSQTLGFVAGGWPVAIDFDGARGPFGKH